MKRPLSFSVIVPTFQRRDTVCDAVRFLCRVQHEGDVELIVVVDGSTDGTVEALRDLACPFPVRVIAKENAGLAAARNRGAAEAANEILLFLDDDMMCRPDIVEQHARSLEEGADAVFGHIPLDSASPESFLALGVGRWAEDRAHRLQSGAAPTLFDLVCGHMSVRRSVFEELGGFDARFTEGGSYGDEDLDFGTRLHDRHKVVFNAAAIAFQRYVVTPRQYLKQWREAGRADVQFARKHPQRSGELFALHGADTLVSRFLLRPIASNDAFSRGACRIAVRFAEHEKSFPKPIRSLVARLFRYARDVTYWAGVREAGGAPRQRKALVLCYHAVADLSSDPILADYGIGPEAFAAQIDDLLGRGFTFISPDELLSLVEGTGRVPSKAVLLTFDDCYEELAGVARSVLQARGVDAIAFAVTGMASGTNEWDQAIGARRLRLLDASGLKELRRCGVEIGCHSRSHRAMSSLSDAELVGETRGGVEDLAKFGIPVPRFFAYPHGVHDERICRATRAAGFEAAFALLPGRAGRYSDRFALPRTEILAHDVGWRFRLKTRAPHVARLFSPGLPRRLAARAAQSLRRRP